eukprot:scaffold11780_cov82-Skeletonema_dohrnii-CCMP3373.AAC.1
MLSLAVDFWVGDFLVITCPSFHTIGGACWTARSGPDDVLAIIERSVAPWSVSWSVSWSVALSVECLGVCLRAVSELSQSCRRVSQSCLRAVSELSQSCRRVSQSCLRVVDSAIRPHPSKKI